MKITCNQKDLASSLALVARVIPSRPVHPSLINIALEASEENQTISLTGFDLSLGMITRFEAQVKEGGAIALPAKLLTDIISKLPEGEVSLEEFGEQLVQIISSSGSYKIKGGLVGEYVALPEPEGVPVIYFSAESLLAGLKGCLFATSTDETKTVLMGVHLVVRDLVLEFAATDGHRLAVVKTINQHESNEPSEFSVTIPASALKELERLVAMPQNKGQLVTFYKCDRGQIIFDLPNHRLTARVIEGNYPNYPNLIPAQFQRTITLNRRDFLGALERVTVLADGKNNLIKVKVDSTNSLILLGVETKDVGSGNESLPADEIVGDDIDIGFNGKYLTEGVRALPSELIQININAPTTPVVLRPASGDLEMTCLIMPVQIRED